MPRTAPSPRRSPTPPADSRPAAPAPTPAPAGPQHAATPARSLLALYSHGLREFVLFGVALLYVLLCPFTKVEESFHLQATHDILVHGVRPGALPAYDHVDFPGVVPRTFLAALALATASAPWRALAAAADIPKVFLQVAVRGTLAAGVCIAYVRVMNAASLRLGFRTSRSLATVAMLSPHFLFYSSRTLPNTFAVLLVLHGIAEWLYLGCAPTTSSGSASAGGSRGATEGGRPPRPPTVRGGTVNIGKVNGGEGRSTTAPSLLAGAIGPPTLWRCLAFFICAILWLRCDMLVLLGPVVLSMLWCRRATFLQLFVAGSVIGIAALATTVLVDSYFWQRWLWPEGEVLWFNTVQNRSHEYGVSPWHWYFTSALPRAMLSMLFMIPVGLLTLIPRKAASSRRGSSSGQGDPAATQDTNKRPRLPWAPALQVQTGIQGDPADFFWRRYQPVSLLGLTKRLRLDGDVLEYFLPGVAFVILYSFLPHKELRFLLPGLPLFFLAAARGLSKAYGFGEALVRGIRAVRPSPEVAAAELFSDAVETALCHTVPQVAEYVGTPHAELLKRHTIASEAASGTSTRSVGRRSNSKVENLPSSYESLGRLAPTDPLLAKVRGLPEGAEGTSPKLAGRVSTVRLVLGICVLGIVGLALFANTIGTLLYVRVSMNNYPGGEALQRLYTAYSHDLHQRADPAQPHLRAGHMLPFRKDTKALLPCPRGDVTTSGPLEFWRQCIDAKSGCPTDFVYWRADPVVEASRVCGNPFSPDTGTIKVHIDVKAAETGVSRFGEAWSDAWVYSKAENLTRPEHFAGFDFLLTENATMHTQYFDVVEVISSLSSFDWNTLQPRRNVALFIMKRKRDAPATP